MILSMAFIYSSIAQSFTDTLMFANFTNSVVFPSDREYRNSVVMANYDCKFLCPYVVVRPVSVSLCKLYLMSGDVVDICDLNLLIIGSIKLLTNNYYCP